MRGEAQEVVRHVPKTETQIAERAVEVRQVPRVEIEGIQEALKNGMFLRG